MRDPALAAEVRLFTGNSVQAQACRSVPQGLKESVWELENRPRIGPRPIGPVAKMCPAREGWDIDSATTSERRRCGTANVGSAAPPALHNLADPYPSPSPDFLHGAPPTSACAAFVKESRMKCANASKVHRKSGSGLGCAVWLPALRAWVRFAVHSRLSHPL